MLLSIPRSFPPFFHSNSPLTHLPTPSSPPPPSLRLKNSKPITPQCRSSSREAAGKSAIQRISEKLRSLGYLPDQPSSVAAEAPPTGPRSAGEIFIPTSYDIPKHRVGHTIDPSWSMPEHPVPVPGSSDTVTRFRDLWKWDQVNSPTAGKDANVPTVAELTLPRKELRRLTTLGIALTKRLKVGKAGITEGVVNGIHERWRRSEVVKIRCEDLCRMNMKRTHEILERKTGGLVVWRSGNILILYRGANYKYPYFHSSENETVNVDDCSEHIVDALVKKDHIIAENTSIASSGDDSKARLPFVTGLGVPNKLRFQLAGEIQLSKEADRLLDGLGPRFTDWWGEDPLPVDGDLLPAIVPGFRKPFRLLPFGLKPILTDRECTILKRLSRHIPCHFALGRNRRLQGLAVSIIKLWEKCEIAKIAIKKGAQNTNGEIMAEELKNLTGGTLLSRDKYFLVLYRGKDFLPPAVSIAIEERRNWNFCHKEASKDDVAPFVNNFSSKIMLVNSSETKLNEATERKGSPKVGRNDISAGSAMRKLDAKLFRTNQRIEESEKHLAELEKMIEPIAIESDKEGISEEERYMLRRVGLSMKPFLLLGRRGVFDGTVENMHLHWKYRELVKIIFNDRYFKNVESTARTLESESGGILVAIERVSKGYAVVIYRGKNYRRPANLRPKTLLNKKEALKRSLEAQRYESLKLHALRLSKSAEQLDYRNASNDLKTNTFHSIELEGLNSSSEPTINIEPLKIVDGIISEAEIGTTNISAEANLEKINVEQGQYLNPTVDYPVASDEHSIKLSSGGSLSLSGSSSLETREQESDVESSFIPAPLSNRERLLLRKQALKMRKRPVLSVGRSNILTGVAKTIKTHFRKHPLAIVNIKGRAKGTSVQELVFELQQATGSVLVSREPNKVILYRGWGEGDAPGTKNELAKAKADFDQMTVSKQLIEAIRRECGLPPVESQ